VTFPRSLIQVPTNPVLSWPGLGGPNYAEGLNVGYRWYDAKGLAPLFPFGFGLSFTQFGFDHLSVTPPATAGTPVTVSVDVTNTGHRAGTEVVQVYVSDPPTAKEPPRQLKGFTKVTLAPGQTKRVSILLDVGALSHWDDTLHQWAADPGTYKVSVGNSSRHLPLEAPLTLTTKVLSGTPTPTLTAPPTRPGLGDLLASVTCPADVVAPAVNGAASLLAPLSLIPSP
jgi:beta-glucosidase